MYKIRKAENHLENCSLKPFINEELPLTHWIYMFSLKTVLTKAD